MNPRSMFVVAAATLLMGLALWTLRHTHTLSAAQPPQVTVRRVSTLDTHGHARKNFRAGNKIELRIQWRVKHAPKGAQQTVEWTVLYAGHPYFHVARHSVARDGNWVRIATATISRRPNLGSHVFRARIDAAGVRAERSVVFTVHR